MNTKDKIIEVALDLFSVNGYESVSVRDISKAVGIKESSLYNHFKNKQDIFDTIIQVCTEKAMNQYKDLKIDQTLQGDFKVYDRISEELLIKISMDLFEFYVTDKDMSRFRKILIIEQFKNKTIQDVYFKYFMDDAIQFQTQLFHYLMEVGALKKSNPETLAYEFYSPIFLLMNRYNTLDETVKKQIVEHIKHFNRTNAN
ncbi:MAG TPA: TetR/AcrR family transcriptional regulator [Erysipelotrichaceae bacterium]|nr:TetR/AcrR family transcriptional regulator [Erysipelotrichaceae bacterium]